MKRIVYYASFTLLGALIGFLLHALLEAFYLRLLLSDFPKYGFGLAWSTWESLHRLGVVTLVVGFAIWGLGRGQHFWKVLYVDQKYSKWVGKLRKDF